jgi:asparagine synthase (glutamine-hydrolysing)
MNSLSDNYTIRYLDFLYTLTDKVKQSYYTDSFTQKIKNQALTSELISQKFYDANTSDKIDQVLYVDMMTYLPDDLLVKVDIASMAHGLESRSPLLDHNLLELSSHIPSNLKLKGLTTGKYIFKKTLEDILPAEILYRKKKGFGMPVDVWFKGDLKDYAYSHLLSKKFENRNILTRKSVKNILDTHINTTIDTSHTIWTLLMLELWFEEYFD